MVSYKLVLPSTGGISLVVPCTPSTNHKDNSSLLLHPPVASFQAVQAPHFPGLSITPVCVALALLFVIQGCIALVAVPGQDSVEQKDGPLMGSHTNPTNHPAPAITRTLPFWKFPWGFIPFSTAPWLEQPGSAAGGERAGREPLINANHFPYTARFCRRGCSAISGYRVPFRFHSLGLCDLSF